MSVTLRCAACGAEVEFEKLSPTMEKTCPGCQVKVRYRECDKQMAIPVSMSLPEEFTHVDLSSVADKSSLLVGRYKKTTEESDASNSVDLMLTKALKSLAHSIGHLDERLTRHEQGEAGEETEAGGSDPDSGKGVKVVVKEGKGAGENGEIVHLEPEEKEKSSADGRANPVAARVLVRREAANAAQEFWREKRGEEDWDERAGPANRLVGFS